SAPLRLLPCALLAACLATPAVTAEKDEAVANRPKVPGKLRLRLQERREAPGGAVKAVERTVDWDAARTAVLICDMWDDHYCKGAAQRVKVMAPRMNEVVTAA